jgi:hypothetical protein
MKTKRNKKRYNFTENQLRKDRNRKHGYWNNIPKWYTRLRNNWVKSQCKNILRNNIINGTDNSYPLYRHNAGRYWF